MKSRPETRLRQSCRVPDVPHKGKQTAINVNSIYERAFLMPKQAYLKLIEIINNCDGCLSILDDAGKWEVFYFARVAKNRLNELFAAVSTINN